MLGHAKSLESRESICGDDIIGELHRHKQPGRNLILVTHNGCINNLIELAGYKKESQQPYGSMIFVRVISPRDVEII